jgi:hypothetical protein
MKRCNYCNLLNQDSAEFCKACKSTNFSPVEESAAQHAPIAAALPANQGTTLTIPKPTEEKAKTDSVHDSGLGNKSEDKELKNSPDNQKIPSGTSHGNAPRHDGEIVTPKPRLWASLRRKIEDMAFLAKLGIILGILSLVYMLWPPIVRRINKWTNQRPSIKTIKAYPQVIQIRERVELTALAEDPENEKLDYEWASDTGQIIGTGSDVELDTSKVSPSAEPSEITVTLIVMDPYGAKSDPYLRRIRVSNNKPVLKSIEVDKMELKVGEPVKLVAVASDPDGDKKLHYEWGCPVGLIDRTDSYKTTLQTSGMNLSATIYPKVSLTVTDENGESTSGDLTLSIRPVVKTYKFRRSLTVRSIRLIIDKGDLVITNTSASAPQSSPTAPPQSEPTPATKPQPDKPNALPSAGPSPKSPP